MIQQIVIRSDSQVSLKPLIESAIRNRLKMLELGIARTRERLTRFEQKFEMSSEEFERRFDGQDLQETLGFLDWWIELEGPRLLEEQYLALQEAKLD